MKKKSTIVNRVNDQEFTKFQKALENLKAARAVNLMFALRYFEKACVNNGNENKTYCNYLLETDGYKLVIDYLQQYIKKEEAVMILLAILDSCLINLPEDITAFKLVDGKLCKILFDIIDKSDFEPSKSAALKILNKLAMYDLAHEIMVEQSTMEFVNQKLEYFIRKDINHLNKSEMIQIGQIIDIIKYFGYNNDIAESLSKSGLLNNMIKIYTQNEDISFMRDLVVKSLVKISENDDLVEIIKTSELNLKKLANNCLHTRNFRFINNVEKVITNLVNKEEFFENLKKAKEKDCPKEVFVFLSFLTKHEFYNENFNDQELLANLINKLEQTEEEDLKLCILKIIGQVIKINQKNINFFKEKGGLTSIMSSLEDTSDDLFMLNIEILNFFSELLTIQGESFTKILNEKDVMNRYIKYFLKLKKQYESFRLNDMNQQKALDSIEYHKSETSRALLEATKEINPKNIVNNNLALGYISCEDLTIALMVFFSKMKEMDPTSKDTFDEDFFENCLLLMKVFKKSKQIHENIFKTLDKIEYSEDQGKALTRLNYPQFLCNIVWTRPEWRFFSLHVLRFVDQLIKNTKIIDLLKGGISTIKLVASIKNFLNEDDYKDFEEHDEEEEETHDILTYPEEREIHKKATYILNQLLDTATVLSFKKSITKTLENFKPLKETILILRAEYAVLTVANGINHFGTEGLKANLQDWLQGNIEVIEKASKYKDFPDKEKLLADCIKCISNYVCITWNENGKNMYQDKEVSRIVFGEFEKYLNKSDRPLKSYVMLQAFKQWLIERIEIIENCNNLMRTKIYDPTSFMMVDESIREKLITSVMDSLYNTHQKFPDNEKVVSLNFEVIILLGYIYPEWKTRAAKNFIPQILEAIENESLGKECHAKALELLKHFTGCDGKSEPNEDLLDAAAKKGAITVLTKAISDSHYDEKFIEKCKPLLEEFGKKEDNLDESENLIDKLIKQIDDFNKTGNKGDVKEISEIIKANDQLNALCMVDPLRIYAFEKNHTGVVNEFWDNLEKERKNDHSNLSKKNVIDKAEKGCLITFTQHLKSLKDEQDMKKMYGKNSSELEDENLIKKCLNSLKRNKKNEQIVLWNSKLINNLFPSDYSQNTRTLAKKMNFQNDLEKILKNHGKSTNPETANEVSNLYMNLSETQDDNMIERIIKKNVRQLNQDLNNGDLNGCLNSLNSILPFISHEVFAEKFDEFDFLDYILKMLKLLHKNLGDKISKSSKDLVEVALGSEHTPEIGVNNKKLLENDIKLAKNLTNFILKLPEELKTKVRNHSQIVQLSDVAGVLNGSTQTFELFRDYLKNPQNLQILQKEHILELCTFLLMKNNKDSFKKDDLGENVELQISTLIFTKKSNLEIGKSTRDSVIRAEQDKEAIISENVKEFGEMVDELLNKKESENLIEKYIRMMNSYKANDENALSNLLSISRIIAALTSSPNENNTLDFQPYAKKLKNAFGTFLDVIRYDKDVNKKMMKFFENNFNHIAKILDNTEDCFRDKELWNKLIDRYFVRSPEMLKNNPITIFENLELTRPIFEHYPNKDKFIESEAEIDIVLDNPKNPDFVGVSENGFFSENNAQNTPKIISNFYRSAISNSIPDELLFNTLSCLAKSSIFNRDFLKSDSFSTFVSKLDNTRYAENIELFIKNADILNDVVTTLMIEKQKNNHDLLNEFFKIPSTQILQPFLQNIIEKYEDLMDISLYSLNNLDNIIKNKSDYFDCELPLLLKDLLNADPDPETRQNVLRLMCKTFNDSSLSEKYQQNNLLGTVLENLEKELFPKNNNTLGSKPKVFGDFKELTDLNEDLQVQKVELNAYLLGELSRNKENALKLANKQNKTNVFSLYEEFEKFGNIPVIATKLIQATRNGVYQLNEEQMEENQDKIDDLILRIPPQIEKYKNFKKTPQWLREILDFFKNYKKHQIPKSALARILKQLSENHNKLPKDRLKDLNELASIYKELVEKLESDPLNNEEAKVLDILNDEVLNILKQPNSEAPYTMFNLEIPLHIRLIANSPNSSMVQKEEALDILNEFAANPEIRDKMLNDNFYVQKSSELINDLRKNKPNVNDIPERLLDVMDRDFCFMKKLTDEREGVVFALDSISNENPLIDNLFDVLLSESDNQKLKIDALQVLKNLLKFGNNKDLENKFLDKIKLLLDRNKNLPNLFTELVDLTNELAKKSNENRDRLVGDKILDPIKSGLQRYPELKPLNAKVASLVFQISNENPSAHDYVFNSEILPLLSQAFLNKQSLKELHENVAKTLLQLSFGNQERKLKLVNLDFIKGLVALLIHYSSPAHYNEEMISLVLKCMANFSVIPEGVRTLLFDGVIPAFRNFFDEYKEKLPTQNKLMLCTISNLSYDPKAEFIDKIIKDKGIELVLDNLDFYTKKEDEETSEAAIDALTHVSSSKNTLQYLEKTKSNAIDVLVDILRQQLSDNLVYKALRCLTRFCEFKPLSDKFMDKRGHGTTVDLFKPYPNEHKIIFQALKLLSSLTTKYEDKLEDFAFAGIPEKIVPYFNLEWPVEIIKQLIELFAKMAKIEMVKQILAENFLEDLIKIMNTHFANKQIVRNGTVLLSVCSDNITSVETIQNQNGNDLADRILDKYISSENTILNDLILMENMIRMHVNSKPEYLSKKTDDKVENIVMTTDPDLQKELNQQAVVVLNLLRDKKFIDIQDSLMPEEGGEESNLEKESQPENPVDEKTSLEKLLPPDIQKFLKQGRILRVYGEDGVCRSMHFYLSKDMTDLKCKHPRENFVKQKWIIPIHQVKDIKYGYEKKTSPIAKSASFFKKAPPPEKCFAVFGPILIDGPRNFHLLCDNSFDARKWFDYLTLIMKEYKKLLVKNLRQDKQIK